VKAAESPLVVEVAESAAPSEQTAEDPAAPLECALVDPPDDPAAACTLENACDER
jgi:hypothetical protein